MTALKRVLAATAVASAAITGTATAQTLPGTVDVSPTATVTPSGYAVVSLGKKNFVGPCDGLLKVVPQLYDALGVASQMVILASKSPTAEERAQAGPVANGIANLFQDFNGVIDACVARTGKAAAPTVARVRQDGAAVVTGMREIALKQDLK